MSKKIPKLVPLELVEINFEENWIKLRIPDPALLNSICFQNNLSGSGNVLCDLTGIQSGKQPDRKGKK